MTAVNYSFVSKQKSAIVSVGIVISFFGIKIGLVKMFYLSSSCSQSFITFVK